MMLVDTSVWIDHFNGHASPQATRLRQAITDNEEIALCGIILTEILLGLRSHEQASKIDNLMNAFTWLPEPDRKDYVQAATIFRDCRSKGVSIRSTIDCLIASLCIRHQVPILTKDRDFNQIATHQPLNLVP
jgi:predicted nucleic acid-binding protein